MIPGMGPQEQELVNKLQAVGMSQADALQYVMQQGQQGTGLIGLQGSDQNLLNQAFSGAESGIRRQADILGQDMAGTRGLNRSDTPVSEAVLREMLPAIQQNESAKASQSLGLGLNLAQLRQQNLQTLLSGINSSPAMAAGLANRFQQERFTGAPIVGSRTQTTRPSLMSSLQQGLGLAQQFGGFLSNPTSGSGSGGSGSGGGGNSPQKSTSGPGSSENQWSTMFSPTTPVVP